MSDPLLGGSATRSARRLVARALRPICVVITIMAVALILIGVLGILGTIAYVSTHPRGAFENENIATVNLFVTNFHGTTGTFVDLITTTLQSTSGTITNLVTTTLQSASGTITNLVTTTLQSASGTITNLVTTTLQSTTGTISNLVSTLITTEDLMVNGDIMLDGIIRERPKNPIQKWDIGVRKHNGVTDKLRYAVLSEQLIQISLPTDANALKGIISLAPSQVIRPDTIPFSNPAGGVDSEPLPGSGTFKTEQLWLVYPEPEFQSAIFARVYSVSADGTQFVMSPFAITNRNNRSLTAVEPWSPDTTRSLLLRRVRLSDVPYNAWVLNMDNFGNAIVKAKYAVNTHKNSQMYLLMAKKTASGTWETVTPTTDGPNLRMVDSMQIATWHLSALEPGAVYSVMAILPTAKLLTLMSLNEPHDGVFFQRELSMCSGSYLSTEFIMPYDASDNRDIRIGATSCTYNKGEEVWGRMANTPYDFYISAGDMVYPDFGGAAILSFNIPNNAGTLLGFVDGQAYSIYQPAAFVFAPGTLVAPSPISFPVDVTTSNNAFLLNGVRYLITVGVYATDVDLLNVLSPLFGSNYVLTINGGVLTVTKPSWSSYGYSQVYEQLMLGDKFQQYVSRTGMYTVVDDHEVFNNVLSYLTGPVRLLGNSSEVALTTAVSDHPDALLYNMHFRVYPPLRLSPAPVPEVDFESIDAALNASDAYFPRQFVGAPVHNTSGHVRWGQVEIIKLESMMFRNTTSNRYEPYALQNIYMRDDQLAYLVERLQASTALVKIVVYSRSISHAWTPFEAMAVIKAKYVDIAMTLGYSKSLAEVCFDKVFAAREAEFVGGYIEWYNQTFIPALEALPASATKNMFFLSGGNHIGDIQYFYNGSPFIEVSTSSVGRPESGGTPQGMLNGASPQSILHSSPHGHTDILVSPKKKTITFSFKSSDNTDNSVTLPLT